MSTIEKEKDMIMMKSIIKEKYNMEMEYIEYKEEIAYKMKKNIIKYYRAYNFEKKECDMLSFEDD